MGGLEKAQVTLANLLSKRGYDVTVMTLTEKKDLLPQLDPKVHYVYKPYKTHPVMRKIPYIRYKFYDDGMWETRSGAKKLYRYYIGNVKYDVEIAFFRGLPIKIISGSTNPKSIKLAWVHTDFRKTKSYLYEFRNEQKVRQAYQRFNAVVCVSDEAKEGFLQTLGDTENLITIHNILPVDRILELSRETPAFGSAKSKFHLVLVGRLVDAVKGQTRLINAVSRLRKESYNLSLTLVGDGKDEAAIKAHIESLGAGDFVFMTGNQINPYPYIVQADLLVCASYLEGYNLTVAEALILGVPVLSTDCAGPNEILDHGKYGMIVENSEQGLYTGIKDLLDHPEKIELLKSKAKERLPFFNSESVMNKITELFGEKND